MRLNVLIFWTSTFFSIAKITIFRKRSALSAIYLWLKTAPSKPTQLMQCIVFVSFGFVELIQSNEIHLENIGLLNHINFANLNKERHKKNLSSHCDHVTCIYNNKQQRPTCICSNNMIDGEMHSISIMQFVLVWGIQTLKIIKIM